MAVVALATPAPAPVPAHALAEEELPPSKLGTKTHWDEVYE